MVARFNDGGVRSQAWFFKNGDWRMSEKDITYAQLPVAIQGAFEASEYAAWKIDDVELLSREGMESVYVIEVEKGNEEYELYYSEDGVLFRAVLDTDKDDDRDDLLPEDLPQVVTDFVQKNFPNAIIVEAEFEDGLLEVDVIDGLEALEVTFDKANAWVMTKREVKEREVPEVVMNAWRNSEFKNWELDDVDFIETPDGDWYNFELEEPDTDREMDLKIGADGTILK